MGRRNDHTREEIKELAVNAAEEIVIEQGYQGLSTRKVATAIGYTVGSLYLVFKNLDELILHVNLRTLEKMMVEIGEVAQENRDNPEECILQLGLAYLKFATDHHNRWRMLFDHHLAANSEIPDWYDQRIKGLFHVAEVPLQAFNPGQSADSYAHSARALWSAIHGICILAMPDKLNIVQAGAPTDLIRTMIHTYLAGELALSKQ